jgi:Zn finger protein HypA/HybF involved in hydrogenase expression
MYPGTIKRVLAQEDIVAARALYPHQGNWCECKKCHGLFFARNPETSKCPAGGAHEVMGHSWYILACDALPMEGWQSDWRWCRKCQGLFFGGSSASKCPASEHGHESVDGDSNYSINYFYVNAPEVDGMRTNWWWCNKCQGLFFHASGSSVCPSGGLHVKGTTEYSLLVRSQLVDY